jgi:hypothetical protein
MIASGGSSLGGTGDNDIGLKYDSAAGFKFPPNVKIDTLYVEGFSTPFQVEQDALLDITNLHAYGCDNPGKVLAGAKVQVTNTDIDYSFNQWNNPVYTGFLLYSETAKSPRLRLIITPKVKMGDAVGKPSSFFYAMDATADKYVWMPEDGGVQFGDSGFNNELPLFGGISTPAIATIKWDPSARRFGSYKPYRVPLNIAGNASLAFTDMAAAETLVNASTGRSITKVDLSRFSKVRVVAQRAATTGAVGSKIIFKYAPSYTTTLANYSNLGVSEVSLSLETAGVAGVVETSWIDLPSAAKGIVFLNPTTIGGDGAADPSLGNCFYEFV